ncbi:MAG: hypothetical protein JWN14_3794, partial [Chthonomonadales bacterium]|nr:hypothetical protein [Chthonomonadales bacterium]
MKRTLLLIAACMLLSSAVRADETLDAIKRELQDLKNRVTALEDANHKL